jgi:hypothetical protein
MQPTWRGFRVAARQFGGELATMAILVALALLCVS